MQYIKHFNQQSDKYLSYRPGYPEPLFDYLASLVDEEVYVWDCGTGNGQAAFALARRFQRVLATDINFLPLVLASQRENLHYLCCAAEKSPILAESMGLVTIAQALHWFNFDDFYQEVRRVTKPMSTIAAWCYALVTINAHLDPIINKLYTDILGDQYWPKERRYIDEHYQTIPFPFKKLAVPQFTIEKKLDFASFVGYLSTWSAVKEYQQRRHKNPIDIIFNDLQAAWGNPKSEHVMRWPVHLLVGVIE